MKILAGMVVALGVMYGVNAAAELPNLDVCTGCHGRDGRSRQPDNPNLAGQKERYLIKALKDFRVGDRKHLMMNYVARGLSDEEIAEIAAYYANFKPAAQPAAEEESWR
jgi:cytochrome c553